MSDTAAATPWTAILQHFAEPGLALDASQTILTLNPAAEQLFGCALAAVAGQPATVLLPGWPAEAAPASLVGRHADGREFPVWVRRLSAAGAAGVTCLFVEAAQPAPPSLLPARETFSWVFQTSPLPMALTNLATDQYVVVNDAFLRGLGFERADVVGRTPAELELFPDPAPAAAARRQLETHGRLETYEMEVRARTGERRAGRFSGGFIDIENHRYLFTIMEDVTERRRAEAALRQSEATYRLLADNAADVIWVYDPAAEAFRYVSPSIERLRGYTVAEVLTQSMRQVVTPASLAEIEALLPARIAAFLAGDPAAVTQTHELEQTRRDGSTVWTEVVTTFVRSAAGGLEVVGVSRDITERRAAARRLAEEAARRRLLFEQSKDGLVLLDEAGAVVEASASFAQMLGVTPAAVTALHAWDWDALHPARAALGAFWPVWPATAGTLPTRVRRLDGTQFEAELTWTPITGAGQKYLFCIYHDLTERYQAQAEVQQAEAKFHTLFHAAPIQNVLYRLIRDPRGEIVDWEIHDINPLGAASIRRSIAEALGQRALALFGAQVMEPYLEICREVMRTGTARQFETHFETNDRHYLSVVTPIGQDYYAILSLDLTDRRLAEIAMRESEAHYRNLFEMMVDGVVYQNARGVITLANPAAERLLGLSLDQMQGRTSLDPRWHAIHEDGAPFPGETHPAMQALRTGQPVHNVVMGIFHPVEERYRWIVVSAVPQFRPGETTPYQVFTTHADITERKTAEAALAESEARYRVIFEGATEGIIVVRLADRSFRYANSALCNLFGYGPAEWGALAIPDLHPAEAAEAVLSEFAALAQGDKSLVAAIPCRRKAGGLFYADIKATLTHLDGGPHLVGFFSDVTERRHAEAQIRALNRELEQRIEARTVELREREATYRALFENSRDGIYLFALTGELIQANPHGLALLGYALDELREVCRRGWAQTDPDDDERQCWQAVVRGEPVALFERGLTTKDGRPLHTEINLSLVSNAVGQPVLVQGVVRDITRRKQAEAALRESELQNRLLFEETPEAISLLDQTGRMVRTNRAYAELTGHPRAALLGRTPPEVGLITAAVCQRLVTAPLRSAAAREAPFDTVEYKLQCATGGERDVESRVFSIQIGGRADFLVTTRDITAQKRAAEILQRANRELERALQLKDEFLAAMSHELRTPLTGILSLSEALEEGIYGPLAPRQAAAVRTVSEAGQHLLALINDVLDLSKIEAGKLTLSRGAVNIDDVCQASLRMIRQPAAHKQLRVSSTLEGGLDGLVADERRLKQMLVNLLSNAVKFTPEGGQVGLDVTRAAGQTVRFTVWDTGLGVAADKLPLLFQPFTQVDGSLTRPHGGTGLGLSLVRRLAELHDGHVGVDSAPGRGSRFYFELPLRAAGIPPAVDAQRPAAPQLEAPRPVYPRLALVVEDSPVDGEQLARYLHDLDIAVVLERTGAAAVARARTVPAEVILLDLLLPDQSGWEVLKALKAQPGTRDIPVIIVSIVDERPAGLAAGAAEYLVKPATRADLQRALDRALAGRETPAPTIETPPWPEAPLILLAEDNLINQRAMQDFLSAQGYQVILALNGVEALARAQEFRPALILMDVQMPQLDGLEVIRRLRAQPEFAATVIIALTALAMPGDRERCLAAGADEYLSKPVRLKKLASLIAERLRPTGA